MTEISGLEITRVPWDPRSVCNLILDEAQNRGPISNLALQKLLYFAYGVYLTETKRPLVYGYFEAWQHGPVHPAAYMAFKSAGSAPINFRATRRDIAARKILPIENPTEGHVIDCVRRIVLAYATQPVGRLVDISHAKEGPWWAVADKARTSIAFGMRIPDDVILARFKHHKVSVSEALTSGGPSEDIPFA